MKRDRTNKSAFKDHAGASRLVNPETSPPVFSFEKMARGNGFCVESCSDDDRAAVAMRLFLLSRMTWQEIHNAPRHGLGTEKIARAALRPALPPGISEDVTFLAVRYHGKRPIIGYRDGRIFHSLFIDHSFSAYDHG